MPATLGFWKDEMWLCNVKPLVSGTLRAAAVSRSSTGGDDSGGDGHGSGSSSS